MKDQLYYHLYQNFLDFHIVLVVGINIFEYINLSINQSNVNTTEKNSTR